MRARAVTGMLPRQVTVRDYAAHWIVGYETSPTNTRVFHEVNLARIIEALGATRVSEVTPSDITRLLSQLISTATSTDAQTPGQHAADRHDLIRVQGARENNLKDVHAELPKRRLTAFTGVVITRSTPWVTSQAHIPGVASAAIPCRCTAGTSHAMAAR